MWATTISSATFESGGRSETSSSRIPPAKKAWRQSSTGRPRAASVRTRSAYAPATTISSSGAPASITAFIRPTLARSLSALARCRGAIVTSQLDAA